MKTLKIAAAVVVAVLLILVVVVVIQPEKARLEKSIVINASDSVIYPYLSHVKLFDDWWPWAKMDAGLTMAHEGVDGAVGSKLIWNGAKAGHGTMNIVALEPNHRITSMITFGEAQEKAYSEFELYPEEEGTRIIWTYNGVNKGVVGKARWVVMGTLLGSQFDLGLKALKKTIEEEPEQQP